MRDALPKFYDFLDRPIVFRSRVALALLVLPLLVSLTQPLWRISMEAPQYPNGLSMDIYAYTLKGGHEGQDLVEINTLNHYIGMHHIDRAELSDLDWIPFALGFLALFALRVAAIGNVRALLDLLVMSGYVFGFSMVRFVYKLYSFGHNLAPTAPVKVAGFTPAIFGTKQVANFTTHSFPQSGTYLAGLFAFGVAFIAIGHLVVGRVEAAKAEKAAAKRGFAVVADAPRVN